MSLKRFGLALGATVLAGAGAVGVPAVAAAQPSPAAPSPGSTAGAMRHHGGFLKGVEHGEGVVQTKQGPVDVAMQQGTLTSVSGSSVTVKSADGWTRTWTVGNNVRVFELRHTLQPSALTPGENIAVAGTTSGTGTTETYTARFVRLHEHAGMQPSAPASPAPGETSSPSGM
ncbi:hypothetical protein KZZ52_27125 [Dactylosporangium sp. AC04546]|uniref:hypothetical protein n=1 Tax=Dactylosporangium sp. AC04546 TaxID=2862460 RepID=UPI001EDFCE2E|nr:hypothetical protein [Dactylosporangium sp. AC04546]WVK88939.1 hypothetical protein KZZ52_27125 [Dactylosporangium sp. AC04546]